MSDMWWVITEQASRHPEFVIATILDSKGSTPRNIGTKFIVLPNGNFIGTIGGGLFESQVIEKSKEAIRKRMSSKESFAFYGQEANASEMICGGEVEVLLQYVHNSHSLFWQIIEKINDLTTAGETALLLTRIDGLQLNPDEELEQKLLAEGKILVGSADLQHNKLSMHLDKAPEGSPHVVELEDRFYFIESIVPTDTVYIIGAGHVGVAVAHLAKFVGFHVVIMDDRADLLSENRIPEVDNVRVLESFDNVFDGFTINASSYLVIVTRGHAYDRTVLAQSLETSAGYIGMIGSRRKVGLIFESLLAEGYTNDQIDTVHAPIGIKIGGETPQEIAVSIVAELISSRYKAMNTNRSKACAG